MEGVGNTSSFVPLIDSNKTWHQNNSHINNVMSKGCFADGECQYFDTIACVRNGIMSLFVTVTGLLCAAKIFKLHANRHPIVHQYIIFYCATVECLICTVHWILGKYAQFDFVMQYLKLVQFLVVGHFYWKLATRALRSENLTNRLLIPVCFLVLVYFTVVSVFGMVMVETSWVECMEPYWLMLSSAEFVLVQLFLLAGIYITRRLNEISTLDSVRRAQKRDIWIIICLFEISALVGLVYDLTLKIMGDEENGCSGIFLHKQELYSPIFGTFMIIKFLLPVWAMLCVFHPIESSPSDREDLLPGYSDESPYTSVFSPDRPKFRQMYSPDSDSPFYDTFGQTSPSPSNIRSPAGIRRSSSNLGTIQEVREDPSRSSSVNS